jgi:hypothetical protein
MIQLAYIDTKDGHKQKRRYIQPSKLLGQGFGVHLKDGGSFYFKCTGGLESFNHKEIGYDYFLTGFDTEGTDLKININDIDMVTGVFENKISRIAKEMLDKGSDEE